MACQLHPEAGHPWNDSMRIVMLASQKNRHSEENIHLRILQSFFFMIKYSILILKNTTDGFNSYHECATLSLHRLSNTLSFTRLAASAQSVASLTNCKVLPPLSKQLK